MANHRTPWVIVLAGGSGKRLSALTCAADGTPVPKQYCTLHGGPSLLAATLDRALALGVAERILVVVATEHERWWRRELAGCDPANVLVQPQNRGTAVGVMWPVRTALDRDPRARVLVMPSDHWFAVPGIALDAMRSALHAVLASPANPVLLGMAAEDPDTEYGWIVPAAAGGGPLPVSRFVEKPPPAEAAALWRAGALWNSFVVAADAAGLWQLCERLLPHVAHGLDSVFAAPAGVRSAALGALYRALPTADFSRAVLQPAASALRVLPVGGCGWTDLGTPRRVAACVAAAGVAREPAQTRAYSVAEVVLETRVRHAVAFGALAAPGGGGGRIDA